MQVPAPTLQAKRGKRTLGGDDRIALMIPSNDSFQSELDQPDVSHESEELVIGGRTGRLLIDWNELIQYRELLWNLTMRDVTVRYKQSALGSTWAVIQPLSMMLLFTLFFGKVAQLPSDGFPYPVFVFAGLIPWTMFSQGLTKATLSIAHEHMVTKIYFPRLYLPAAAVGVFLVDLLISLGIYAVILFFYRVVPSWTVIFLPVLVLLTYVATLGMGLFFSAISVFYRDAGFFVPYLTQFMMFLTPVVYPLSMIEEGSNLRSLMSLNPMFGIVIAYRSAILGVEWDKTSLAISTASTLGLFVAALFFFRWLEPHFVDDV